MADFDATRALMDDDSFLPLIHGDPVGAAALIKSQSDEIERLRAERDALLSAEPVAWAYYWSDGGLCAIELTRRDPKDSDEVVEVPLFTRKRYEA